MISWSVGVKAVKPGNYCYTCSHTQRKCWGSVSAAHTMFQLRTCKLKVQTVFVSVADILKWENQLWISKQWFHFVTVCSNGSRDILLTLQTNKHPHVSNKQIINWGGKKRAQVWVSTCRGRQRVTPDLQSAHLKWKMIISNFNQLDILDWIYEFY